MHKLVFFGNEKLATGITNNNVVSQMLVKSGYEIVVKVKDEIPPQIADYGAQAAVLVAYGRIVPQNIIDLFPASIINIHPSLLPLYRGPTPIETAILDGAKVTGVSLMQLVKKMDAGPILAQKKLVLTGKESKQELADKLLKMGAELLLEYLPKILDGSAKSVYQDESKATYSQLIKKEDGKVTWRKAAEQIEHEVRAYAGWPKSQAKIFGHEAIITKARAAKGQNDGALVIKCSPGYLEILELKAPSGRTMSGAEFIRGYSKQN